MFVWACAAGCGAAPATTPTGPVDQLRLSPEQVGALKLAISPVAEEGVGGAVVASGRITFDDLRVTHVFSPVTGRIARILAQPGRRSKRGAPLCAIDSPDLGQAFSDLAKAQAVLAQTEKDWHRQRQLYQAHAAAQRDFEAAESAYLNAGAELERARRKALLLKKSGGDAVTQEFVLTAPIDGEVIMRAVNLGGEVQGQYANGGSAVELFTIGDMDRVWALADVFESDVPLIRKGERTSVRVEAFPDRLFTGEVEWISGAFEPSSRTAKVRCSIDNRDHALKAEMYATVTLTVAQARALAIPRTALVMLGEQPMVFVETAGPPGRLWFERRPISVDDEDHGDFLPVTHGLKAGERIVVAGAKSLLGML